MTGDMQLVVQEALDMILSDFFWAIFFFVSSVPKTSVCVISSFAGAEMITFLAPPLMCPDAVSLFVKKPVHSRTTSTLSFAHGSFAGSLWAYTGNNFASTMRLLFSIEIFFWYMT